MQFNFIMLKSFLPLVLVLSSHFAQADRISCMSYVVNYAGRTEVTSVNRLEPWLSRLRDAGLGELSALIEQKKIMVREKEGGWTEPVNWRSTLIRGRESRGYMILLNRNAIQNESDSFWQLANALYEIYFYRSLWGLPPDFWDSHDLSVNYLTSRAPAYFEALHRITPLMYGLYSRLEEAERAKLPKRQISEPGLLGQTTRLWAAPIDNQLNQRDFETFSREGEARLNEVLKNRLEPRVIIGQYAGYARKALLVTTVYSAIIASAHLPATVHTANVIGSAAYQMVRSGAVNSADKNERYVNNMRMSLRRQELRRDELRSLPSLTYEQKSELKDVEDEIEAILDDTPELKNE